MDEGHTRDHRLTNTSLRPGVYDYSKGATGFMFFLLHSCKLCVHLGLSAQCGGETKQNKYCTYGKWLRVVPDRQCRDDRLFGRLGVWVAQVCEGMDGPPGLQVLRHTDGCSLPGFP